MFWEALKILDEWERENLPNADTRFVVAFLIWLRKHAVHGGTVGDLYKSTRYSEPTMRSCMHRFVRAGLVEVQKDSADPRRSIVRPTPRLQASIEPFERRLTEAADCIGRKRGQAKSNDRATGKGRTAEIGPEMSSQESGHARTIRRGTD